MKFNGSCSLLGGLSSVFKKKEDDKENRTQGIKVCLLGWGEVLSYETLISVVRMWTSVCVWVGTDLKVDFHQKKFKTTELETPVRFLLLTTVSFCSFSIPEIVVFLLYYLCLSYAYQIILCPMNPIGPWKWQRRVLYGAMMPVRQKCNASKDMGAFLKDRTQKSKDRDVIQALEIGRRPQIWSWRSWQGGFTLDNEREGRKVTSEGFTVEFVL